MTATSQEMPGLRTGGPETTPAVHFPRFCLVAAASAAAGDIVGGIHIGTRDVSAYWTLLLAILIGVMLLAETSQSQRRVWDTPVDGSRGGRTPDGGRRIPAFLLAFLFWASAITLINGVNTAAVQNICCFFILIGGIMLAYTTAREGADHKLLDLLLIIGWVRAVAYGVVLLRDGFGASNVLYARDFAVISLIVMAASIPARRTNWWARWLPFILWVEIVASGSRTASAAGGALLVCLVVRSRRGGKAVKASLMLAAILLASWYAINHLPQLHDRFFGGDQARVSDIQVNTEGRQSVWPVIIRAAEVHPWTGSGGGTATEITRADFAGAGEPHNDYLRLWADYGFIGLGLWLAGVAMLLRRTWGRAIVRHSDQAAIHYAACLALGAISIVAITDNVFIYHFDVTPLAALVGLSLAQPAIQRVPPAPALDPAVDQTRQVSPVVG